MRPLRDIRWRCLACSILGLLPCAADPVLTVESAGNGLLPANYTTSKLFVDEVAGTFVPVTVSFSPDKPNLTAVEVYTNLNRRDRAGDDADGDSVEDGILLPPGDLVVAGSDSNYYAAYTMTDIGGGAFRTTINATKTGAAGVESSAGSSAPGVPNPAAANTPVAVLHPAGDEDGDLSSNADEDAAGTTPFDSESRFELISISKNGAGGIDITFGSDAEPRLYTVRSCDDLVSWQNEDEAGAVDFPGSGGVTTTFTDTNPGSGRKFYKVLVSKP